MPSQRVIYVMNPPTQLGIFLVDLNLLTTPLHTQPQLHQAFDPNRCVFTD